MSATGYYYLHEDGSLIYKPLAVVESDPSYFDSPFVRKVWVLDSDARESRWDIVVEALALGADRKRVDDLAESWKLTNGDAYEYANRRSFSLVETNEGPLCWHAIANDPSPNPSTIVRGTGATALDAIADLSKKAAIR